MIKRILSCVLSAACLFTPVVISAEENGVIGHIYSTDISAYVGKCPIDSYNIGGKTVIIAEDLDASGYSHSYTYNDEKRLLSIRSGFSTPWGEFAEIPRGKTGAILGDVYETDIQVTYNGIPVTGYNIGGRTAICIEEIGELTGSPNAEYGFSKYYANHVWDEENRTITLHTFTDNFHEISGLVTSRVFYTFGDNVLTVHPDDTEVYASLAPSKNGVPLLKGDYHMDGYASYWFSEGFDKQPIKPLYLKAGETVTEIGTVFTIPQPETESERTYLHVDNPEEALKLVNSVRTPALSYEDAMAKLAAQYTEVKRIEMDGYTALHMKDEAGTDFIYAVKKTGGHLLIEKHDDSYRKDRIVDIVREDRYTPDELHVTVYPYTDNHGKTVTMSSVHHLDNLKFD